MAAAAGSASEQPAAAGRSGALRQAMLRRGYVHLRGALPPSVVAPLVAELAEELRNPSVPPESGTPHVTLSDPSTWPSGGARRVIEAVPTRGADGGGCRSSEHWLALAASPALGAALDDLLGEGCWELPLNGTSNGSQEGPL